MGVVGLGNRVGLVLEAEDRRDRAERLLFRDPHRGVEAREHRRLVEGAAELVPLAADRDFRALVHGVGDMRLDLLDRLLVDQRALGDAGRSRPRP